MRRRIPLIIGTAAVAVLAGTAVLASASASPRNDSPVVPGPTTGLQGGSDRDSRTEVGDDRSPGTTTPTVVTPTVVTPTTPAPTVVTPTTIDDHGGRRTEADDDRRTTTTVPGAPPVTVDDGRHGTDDGPDHDATPDDSGHHGGEDRSGRRGGEDRTDTTPTTTPTTVDDHGGRRGRGSDDVNDEPDDSDGRS